MKLVSEQFPTAKRIANKLPSSQDGNTNLDCLWKRMDIPPLRSRYSRRILNHCNHNRRLSHAPACSPLLETMGTETHHPDPIHDTRLRRRLLGVLRLL